MLVNIGHKVTNKRAKNKIKKHFFLFLLSSECHNLLSFYHGDFYDDIFKGAVSGVCRDILDFLYDVEAFFHLAENSIGAIKMGCAAKGGVEVLLHLRQTTCLGVLELHLVNKILHLARAEGSAPGDTQGLASEHIPLATSR